MRLLLAGVGRLKTGPERDLCDRYLGRIRGIARQAGVAGVDAWDIDEARSRGSDERKREEAAGLATRLGAGVEAIVFDERGRTFSSQDFAAMIERARDGGTSTLAFIVGGPDGLDAVFRARAAHQYSFGAATLPHQLVRVLVAEQIYRALTILTGHPYHRA